MKAMVQFPLKVYLLIQHLSLAPLQKDGTRTLPWTFMFWVDAVSVDRIGNVGSLCFPLDSDFCFSRKSDLPKFSVSLFELLLKVPRLTPFLQ